MRGRYTIARLSAGSGLAIGGHVHGWAFSLLLHAAAVSTTVAAMNGLSLLPEQEPFRWEISLVNSARSELPAQPSPRSQPPPAEPMASTTPPELPRPVVTKPVEPETVVQTVEPVRESVEQVTATAYTAPEPITEKIVAAVQPASAPMEAPTQPTQIAALPPTASSVAEPTGSVAAVPAATTQSSQGNVRADYGWLAEMLWKRVVELKRYPGTARLNGWEGRVVVRAVIQMDGHLTALSVAESSGHEVLDRAAMDAVRLACPLKLKHHLFGRSTVVVQVPINYTLTN